MSPSWFSCVQLGPPIEVFALNKSYLDDNHPKKVNLGVGAYRTNEGKPWVLPVVRKTEQQMAANEELNHEYLPVLGLDTFTSAATKMLLGSDSPAWTEGRAFGIQSLSGTGALKIGADFLHKHLKLTTFYYSTPTWENHGLIFTNAGFTEPRQYRYWNPATKSIDFDGMLEDLRNAPKGSVIILHACAHNPTGCDPTPEQWKQIADVVEEKGLFPFFDSAYQGFASGDLVRDAHAVRYFVQRGFELFCSQSFAKNFGLYNERVGNLTVVMKSQQCIPEVKSQITLLIRGNYSNPPNHGARIVSSVLNDDKLYKEWEEAIKTMSSRILSMRQGLKERLQKLQTPGNWDHITNQIGMFSYTGLSEPQVAHMVKEHHVYLLKSGRINIAGLTTNNIDHVANAIHDSVTKIPA